MASRKSYASYAIALIVPSILIGAWEIIVRMQLVPPSQAAAPSDVLIRLFDLVTSGIIIRHALNSLLRLISGVTIGAAVGVVSGILLARSVVADKLLSPTVQLLAGVPVVVWIPFWVMFFGTGEAFKISMAAISTYFLVHLYTFQGVRSVERDYLELADIYEKGHWEKVRQVLLPSAAPAILTAVRTSLAFGWIVIFFVEYASARYGSEGLGWFIADSRAVGKIEEEFAGLLFLGIIAFISDSLVAKAQKYLLVWSDTMGTIIEMDREKS